MENVIKEYYTRRYTLSIGITENNNFHLLVICNKTKAEYISNIIYNKSKVIPSNKLIIERCIHTLLENASDTFRYDEEKDELIEV